MNADEAAEREFDMMVHTLAIGGYSASDGVPYTWKVDDDLFLDGNGWHHAIDLFRWTGEAENEYVRTFRTADALLHFLAEVEGQLNLFAPTDERCPVCLSEAGRRPPTCGTCSP